MHNSDKKVIMETQTQNQRDETTPELRFSIFFFFFFGSTEPHRLLFFIIICRKARDVFNHCMIGIGQRVDELERVATELAEYVPQLTKMVQTCVEDLNDALSELAKHTDPHFLD